MKVIPLEDLKRIIQKYEIRRDVRAEKEIEEAAFNLADWNQTWISPEYDVPATDEQVLVIVCGKYGKQGYEHAFELASYWKDEGWILEGIPKEDSEFKVEWWTPLPPSPEDK